MKKPLSVRICNFLSCLFQDEIVSEISLSCCRTLQSRLKMGRKRVQVKPVFVSEVLELCSELAPPWVFTTCILF